MELGEVLYFETPNALRRWFERNQAKAPELWVGMYKKATGRPSVTYKEVVDQALCFGWIDGIRKSVDADSSALRLTPRRARSIWSQVNLRRMSELIEAGLVHPAGLATFEARDPSRTYQYSFEVAPNGLDPEYEQALRANPEAWGFWEMQPPGYRQTVAHWVHSAKQEATRQRRLATLIEDSAAGRRIGILQRPTKSKP